MNTNKPGISSRNLKREIRDIQDAARRIAASKNSARRFLLATGMYSGNGQIKPQYR